MIWCLTLSSIDLFYTYCSNPKITNPKQCLRTVQCYITEAQEHEDNYSSLYFIAPSCLSGLVIRTGSNSSLALYCKFGKGQTGVSVSTLWSLIMEQMGVPDFSFCLMKPEGKDSQNTHTYRGVQNTVTSNLLQWSLPYHHKLRYSSWVCLCNDSDRKTPAEILSMCLQ